MKYILLLLLFVSQHSYAQDACVACPPASDIVIRINDEAKAPNKEFDIEVYMTNNTEEDIFSWQFTMSYDTTYLVPTNVDFRCDECIFGSNSEKPGFVQAAAASNGKAPLPDSSIVVSVYFKTKPNITFAETTVGFEEFIVDEFALEVNYSDTAVVTIDETLPVELVSFDALVDRNDVYITWSTKGEINNAGFDIYRDSLLLGHVPGVGHSSSTLLYEYVDRLVPDGAYEYLLVQRDFDGAYEAFGPLYVTISTVAKPEVQNVYPNPFNPSTTLSFTLPQYSEVTIQAVNILGRTVFTHTATFDAGYNEYVLELGHLPSGFYFITLDYQGMRSDSITAILQK